jgi:hypothetical protein
MEVAGGPIVFGIIGMLIYQQYLRRKAAQVQI